MKIAIKHILFTLTVILNLTIISTVANAQDFEFGRLTHQDSAFKSYSEDLSANAVVLQEYGVLTYDTIPPYLLQHHYHIKIKVLKTEGLNYGNIKIPYYKWNAEHSETIKTFEAVVYTPNESGSYISTLCDMRAGHTVDQSKNDKIFTYALPNITVGSIIEYRYILQTPNKNDFIPWVFQQSIPNLHSEYVVHMPKPLNYRVMLKGSRLLSKNLLIKPPGCVYHKNLWQCSKLIYAMDSIPAFVPEDRMTAPVNYVPALYFESVGYAYKKNADKLLIAGWSDIEKGLNSDETFGKQLKQQAFFKRKSKNSVSQNNDTIATAQSIYNFINHHIKWNHEDGAYAYTGVEKALNSGKGNTGDINLALVAALKAYDIQADPVITSTKENGQASKSYASLKGFNYVLARVSINKRTYLLDATDPLLPFGMLPERCLNDRGRVIRDRDSSYWIDLKPVFRKRTSYIADITLNNDGSLTGNVKNYTSGYAALAKRGQVKNSNSVNEYLENFGETFYNTKIIKSSIENLDSLHLPICESYDIKIAQAPINSKKQILLNPYLLNRINENPFKLSERLYPIDCGPPSEQRYILTLHLPDNYEIESLPDVVAIALPDNGGRFKTLYDQSSNTLIFSHIVQLDQSVYMPNEYPYLKELFNKIIQAQKADIILKRKS